MPPTPNRDHRKHESERPYLPLSLHIRSIAATGLVVGTLICLINDSFTAMATVEITLNYLLPIAVSTWSRFSLIRQIAGAASAPGIKRGQAHQEEE